jgi:hypothetical protein
MDRFVTRTRTRTEAFLIPRVEEKDVVGTYETRFEEQEDATCNRPIGEQEDGSHSPDVNKSEFVPLNHDVDPFLNKGQLETLEDIARIIAEAGV